MRIKTLLLVGLLGTSTLASAAPAKKAPAAKQAKAKAPPPVKKKVVPPVSAEAKKKLAANMGPFKWGMTKDEIIAGLQKDLDARYEEKIKATSDIPMQDRLRKEKKTELTRIASTYIAFEGKKGGWDVSIIEEEFAHNTGESMLERWENQDGKNNRRFFFFKDGKLYKMFIQLDVSILAEDKRNFEELKQKMTQLYGAGDVEGSTITWRTAEFDVRAVDQLKSYGAIAIAIEDPRTTKLLIAERAEKAPPKAATNPVINAIVDKDGTSHPDVKNNTAVDAVIEQNGGKKK